MTEAEWLTCTDHFTMLNHLRYAGVPRPVRWLVKFWTTEDQGLPQRKYELLQEALQSCGMEYTTLEGGDVLVTEQYMDQTREVGRFPVTPVQRLPGRHDIPLNPQEERALDHFVAQASAVPAYDGYQTRLVRCVFGNPFRPVVFDPRWCSETAVALATGIYAERAFDRMPVLADALEEAGCDHPDVLAHCRDPHQPHARGCWVVDLVLNKS